ncbi:MAG TPA: 3-phosphoshikimate 1-carboxyvinyltransferase, partial [Bacteroidales bacterium]|nr:3-phosphoshikimate 1-carboxyvinyltransferase [Bacteroidales bacterium]
MLIKALNNGSFTINNLSSAEDTMLMQKLLEEIKLTQQYNNSKKVFNAGNSGTVFRFLTAYCSILPGEWILDGNVRMQQRPIYHLVDALEELGVKIKYLKKIGFPPICIKGGFINKNYVAIDASISSQFISALMLIAPTIKGGLIINIKNDIASYPYIEMTSYIMDK